MLITGFYLVGIAGIAVAILAARQFGAFGPDRTPQAMASVTPQPSLAAFEPYQPVERTPTPVPATCSYTIPSTVEVIDGDENYANVRPGDVLCLPAGTRGNLKVFDLHGTADQPITIRNADGVVTITGTTERTGGIGLIRTSWVRISGAGVASQCGAGFDPAEQQCGIQMEDVLHGIKVGTSGEVSGIEIDHIWVRATSTQNHSTGFTIHPQPGQTVAGFYVHHNYLSDIYREGMYIGSEPRDNPMPRLGKMTNVEVCYNLVERTGYDGIKLKVATENVSVHDNIVRDPALAKFLHHESGIQLTTSVGDVYNNVVEGGVEGIATGRELDDPGTRFFNNLVIGTHEQGIRITEDGALIHNNTVVDAGSIGIDAPGTATQVFDNIVVGSTGPPIAGKHLTDFRNLVGAVSAARFVDPAGGDYRLLAGSPGVDQGARSGPIPAFDLGRVRRPQGSRTDLGVYEFRATDPSG